MPPRRAVTGRLARRNVEPHEQGVLNTPEVQPQGEITNAKFREAVQMLSQTVTNQIMHFADVERVELVAYPMKGVARIWFDQWKKNRVEGAPFVSWALFEEALLGLFFPVNREKQRNMMSVFIAGLSRLSTKEGKAAMLIGDMDIARLMIHVQQVEEDKLRDKEEFKNKRAKTSGNESGQQKDNANRIHSGVCCDGSIGCFKCVAPSDRATSRGATSGASRGGNRLYAITICKEQEDSPDVVTGMIQVFNFDVYALLDPGANLSFVTPYVAMNFDVLPKKLIEPFSVATPTSKSIQVERVYRDCTISINHKSTMADLVELDMVAFDIILGMDWLHACYALGDCRTRVVKFQFPNELVIE
ncbi:hypothetical protein MTR67_038907 [Solanum verrucosum]|uniref:Gag-pol polyprotein n=1 Tax=Solanum verrucosum TaxID=315347 RepID=A0AAF0UGE6_SOLVR|nr:hypothetical protein MTR67_038907 [Solanum verrucosum]